MLRSGYSTSFWLKGFWLKGLVNRTDQLHNTVRATKGVQYSIVPLFGQTFVTAGMLLINACCDRGTVEYLFLAKTFVTDGMILINVCNDRGTVPFLGQNIF